MNNILWRTSEKQNERCKETLNSWDNKQPGLSEHKAIVLNFRQIISNVQGVSFRTVFFENVPETKR